MTYEHINDIQPSGEHYVIRLNTEPNRNDVKFRPDASKAPVTNDFAPAVDHSAISESETSCTCFVFSYDAETPSSYAWGRARIAGRRDQQALFDQGGMPSASLSGHITVCSSSHAVSGRETSTNSSHITEIKAGRLLTFLDLPGEVRNLIYLYALSANHNKSQSTLWLDRRGQTYSFGTSLLYLNRQVHAEASSIFYGANRFTIIRFSGVGVLLALLDKHMLAIALTCKAAFCTRMAMVICVQNSGDIGDGSWQLVIAARDIDILAMILFELQVEHDIIHTSLTVIILNNFGESDDEHSREVLKPMSMLRGFRKIKASKNLEEKSYKDLLGPTVNPLWVCDFMGFIDLLKRKGRAKSNEKNFSSAAFYFARACQIVRMGTALNPQFLQQPVNFKEIIANLAYLEAEALMKAKKYARAHQTTILILSYWKTSSAHGLSDSFKADVCHLRAELDELHGSLVKLKNALFWFQETLRLNPAHPTVKKAIKRLEKKIYFADTANW